MFKVDTVEQFFILQFIRKHFDTEKIELHLIDKNGEIAEFSYEKGEKDSICMKIGKEEMYFSIWLESNYEKNEKEKRAFSHNRKLFKNLQK